MNKFEIIAKTNITDKEGNNCGFDTDVRIVSYDYEPNNGNSIIDCINKTTNEVETKFDEIRQQYYNLGLRAEFRSFTARFGRVDGTTIDEVDLNLATLSEIRNLIAKFYLV